MKKFLLVHKQVLSFFILFVLLNIFLYAFVYYTHVKLRLSTEILEISYHFYPVSSFDQNHINYFKLFSANDAQWYLRIATQGYPNHPHAGKINSDGDTYAFFPLYPIVLAIFNSISHNILLTAFIVSNILLVINFFSLYFVISSITSSRIALKTIFLLFLFPVSIFYRAYYAEGLFLFLLIWFSYFWIKRKFLWSSICLSLLLVTKANGFFLFLIYAFYLFKQHVIHKNRKQNLGSFFYLLFIVSIPLWFWMGYCRLNTGDMLYFYHVQKDWFPINVQPILFNLQVMSHFFNLPLHAMVFSKWEVSIVIVVGLILLLANHKVRQELWWISLCLWLLPLLSTDLTSFSRFQSASFPLFMYIASVLPNKYYALVLLLFFVGLLLTMVAFVNWYWIG